MAEEKRTFDSVMEETRVFEPTLSLSRGAYVKSLAEYEAIYRRSMEDPAEFWSEKAQQLDWFRKWDRVLDSDFAKAEIRWFTGGTLNGAFNCLDRHVRNGKMDKPALIWEGDASGENRIYTYEELHREVCRFANVLKKKGVRRGDRVALYMPMVPELPIAMLACARIGAVHSVVFGGFSAESLRDRILDCEAKLLVTTNGAFRGGRVIGLKENADIALQECPSVEACIVYRRSNVDVDMKPGRDTWWEEEMDAKDITPDCEPEEMGAEDPLFILYTSGSTGKPKGVLHTTGGYLLYALQTTKWIFDIREDNIYWCTADIGWVTGHSYIVYGPLSLGTTTVMFEGVPTYPHADRFWEIVEKYKVNVFYTAPTAIRALAREGDDWPRKRDLSSLRILGTVGEPINPEAWMWYYNVIGGGRCPIMDTYWQTETGGSIITPLPGAIPIKPGSATLPFPGIDAVIVREDGSQCEVNEGGYLCVRKPWPGIMRTVYGDPDRFRDTYFSQFPGMYFTGDGARRDKDGYFWLMGRVDDVINVSGHRLGTAEIESALVSHPEVAEAAVVGFSHSIKGQGIYAFVTLKSGVKQSDDLKKVLVGHVRKEIGPIATPDKIHFADALPKTRSGKIMRRILRKIAEGDIENLGDTTTLADPSVVDTLIAGRQ